ncbi:MAG: HEAT repeat domain-containing protein [Planctomycetaceae bacterium]|nr:HEAT repeat domain-containing protein [Planctomycetaceae bacterium]
MTLFDHRLAAWLLPLLLSGSAFAQRDLQDIPVPDAAQEQATFVLPDGFEVNLFAADPRIAKPIQMNFDPSGRLWIVSSEVYPHIEPGAEAKDRVLVLEDKDHDGVSDATHEFATGLLIPTGIAPGDGGVYVANSTELLHFADTDGDLVADQRRVVLSGFGTEDTHHILHTLRWGPDGYLYFNQSIYIHSHIETPWGVRRLNAGGIWQFRPETLELGVFMKGLVNSWGHHFDRYGQSFATDGAGGDGINYIVPGGYYVTAANPPKLLRGLNPGSPKHCGLEIVETPMLPPDWQGSAITNDFRGHRVCRFNLSEDRSGYQSKEQQEVIRSDHVAFRPIDVKLGPDGAIYIADWYNPIIQHGEVDFRDPRRDHTHGRIWRVTWKGAPQREHLDIAALQNDELLNLLSDPDGYRRQMAKQVLREREGLTAEELATRRNADLNEHEQLELLWTAQATRRPDLDLLRQLLQAEDGRVRAAAVRVLSQWRHLLGEEAGQRLTKLVNDDHPRVRLEAVRALAFSPNPRPAKVFADGVQPVEAVLQATDHPTDRFLDYAIWLSTFELAGDWVPKFQAGEVTFGNRVDHLISAFAVVGRGAPVDALLGRLYDDSISGPQRTRLVQLIADSGDGRQIARMIAAAGQAGADTSPVQIALASSRRRGNLRVPIEESTLQDYLKSESPARQLAFRMLGQWKLPDAVNRLEKLLNDGELSVAERRAVLDGVFLYGNAKAAQLLATRIQDKNEAATLRIHSAALLTQLAPQQGVRASAMLLTTLEAKDRPADLARSVLSVKNGDKLLADALSNRTLSESVARELLSVTRESGRPAPGLEAALKAAANLKSRKSLTAEQRDALLAMSKTDVTAADGEAIFRNPQLGCLKCHAVGGAGGKVGPDMISLGGSAQPDYLLESLLNPNAKVKENYNTTVVVTTAGKMYSGVKTKQSKQELVLRNAEDKLVSIPTADIDETADGVSLMPEGLVDSLTDREIAALVRFLSELGRTPEYTMSRRQLARTWETMQPTQQAAFRLRRTSYAMAATDDPAFTWSRAWSVVGGSLPLSDIPSVTVRNRVAAGSQGVGFARCRLQAETRGTVMLSINDASGLELRLNDKPVDIAPQMQLNVPVGEHRLTFTVDQSQRTTPLEVEILTQGTTSVARFMN